MTSLSLDPTSEPLRGGVLQQTRHAWVRVDPPVWPFVWRGLLPTLGLVLLAWYGLSTFARTEMEHTVAQEVRAQLDGHGAKWVDMNVDGQEVTLSGIPAKAGDGDAAMQWAREATCPSPFGRKLCAVEVHGNFATAEPAAAPISPPAAASQAAALCEHSLADITANRKIEFATGSAVLAPSSAALLDALAKAAAQCPGTVIVQGHTDSLGQADANKVLSLGRAEAVRAELMRRGMAANRIRAEGYGAEQPIGDNATATGRSQNRRIEFRALAGAN